ncbi:MAG: hypothetical protein R3B47_19835 [Bacteroidia bacterium]
MFRNDKSEEVIIKNIKEGISQIKKTKKKLVAKNKRYEEAEMILITNISNQEVINKAKKETREDLSRYRIDILSPEVFAAFAWKLIKGNPF